MIQEIFLSPTWSLDVTASCLVIFETAAIDPPKSLDIDHHPCAIATVSPYGEKRSGARTPMNESEWAALEARPGSFQSRNETDPATFAIVFNSTIDTCPECQCDA